MSPLHCQIDGSLRVHFYVFMQNVRPGQTNEAESHSLLDQFVEAGGNFLDTADVYQRGLSEEIIGSWLSKKPSLRQKLIIATKVCGAMDSSPNSRGLTRHHIMNGIEGSLKRLKTDYIDIYQVCCFNICIFYM